MKYRVYKEGKWWYVKIKGWLFWHDLIDEHDPYRQPERAAFSSAEEAEAYMQSIS